MRVLSLTCLNFAFAASLFATLASCGGIDTPEEFCEASAKAICAKIYERDCFTEAEKIAFGSSSECEVTQQTACLEQSKEAGAKFDKKKAEDCLDALERIQCKDFKRGRPLECGGVFGAASSQPIEDEDDEQS